MLGECSVLVSVAAVHIPRHPVVHVQRADTHLPSGTQGQYDLMKTLDIPQALRESNLIVAHLRYPYAALIAEPGAGDWGRPPSNILEG